MNPPIINICLERRAGPVRKDTIVYYQRELVLTLIKQFLKSELIALTNKDNILVLITENDVSKGWVNKPKGMLQILLEHGFIDEGQVKNVRSSRYLKDGRKGDIDADGKLTKEGQHHSLHTLLMK